MKKDMPLEGLRWSRDSGSALYDTPQNGRSRTGWGEFPYSATVFPYYLLLFSKKYTTFVPIIKQNYASKQNNASKQ